MPIKWSNSEHYTQWKAWNEQGFILEHEASESLCCFSKYVQTWKNLSCMLCCQRNWQDSSSLITINSFFMGVFTFFSVNALRLILNWLFLLLCFSKRMQVLQFNHRRLFVGTIPAHEREDIEHSTHVPLRFSRTTSPGSEVHEMIFHYCSNN